MGSAVSMMGTGWEQYLSEREASKECRRRCGTGR